MTNKVTHYVEILKITPTGMVGVSAAQRMRTGRNHFFKVSTQDIDLSDDGNGRTRVWWMDEDEIEHVVIACEVISNSIQEQVNGKL